MKIVYFLAYLSLFVTFALSVNATPKIDAVTAVFAPLQMYKEDKPVGYAVETVEEILKRLTDKGFITPSIVRILPWKRAMETAKRRPFTLFFSLSRTPEREDQFQWVGEISPYEVYFYRLNENEKATGTTLDSLKGKGLKLAVQRFSNIEKVLLNKGFEPGTDFVTYSHYSKGIPMLFSNRFDMLPLTRFVARTNICNLGYDGDGVTPVMKIKEISHPLWLAFGNLTPPDLVAQVREELNILKREGFVKKVREKYLADWANQPCQKIN